MSYRPLTLAAPQALSVRAVPGAAGQPRTAVRYRLGPGLDQTPLGAAVGMAPVRYRALPEPVTLLPPQTSSRLAPPPTCVALSGDGTRAAVGVGSSLYVLDLTKEDKSASQAKEVVPKGPPRQAPLRGVQRRTIR